MTTIAPDQTAAPTVWLTRSNAAWADALARHEPGDLIVVWCELRAPGTPGSHGPDLVYRGDGAGRAVLARDLTPTEATWVSQAKATQRWIKELT